MTFGGYDAFDDPYSYRGTGIRFGLISSTRRIERGWRPSELGPETWTGR